MFMTMSFRTRECLGAMALIAAANLSPAAPTITWQSVGVGGGGALFAPSFSPHNSNQLYISCDMSELFRTDNLGATWAPVPFRQYVGNRYSKVQFTSDPNVLYGLDYTLEDLLDVIRPKKSIDGGATWSFLPSDPTGSYGYYLLADPTGTQRVIITDYLRVYFSSNGGTTWSQKYATSDPNGIIAPGAFWDGLSIYVGTSDGLLVSTDGGTTFNLQATTGIAAGRKIVSFCGAKAGATTRLFALTADAGDAWAGVQPDDLWWPVQTVYTIDVGQPSWTSVNTGLPTGNGNSLALIDCARNNINVAYVSGQRDDETPMVYRTANGGTSWSSVLTPATNTNIETGWSGHQGDRQWTYGAGTLGLAVAPTDAARVAFTDLGFVHLTTNSGTTWTQAYVNPADENPTGLATPKGKAYHGVGLEDTTCWRLTWFDASNMWACFSDIQGIRSTDGGASWSFNYTGHSDNSSYQCLVHPSTGTAYMATSSIHDLYKTTRLQDSPLDGGDGAIRFSTNQGATWQLLHDFNHIVFDLALDPNNAERMYAAVVHSGVDGGLWVTNNLSAGAGSTWTKLTNPPRTQGHPYTIKVLNDGTLVSTFCARRDGGGTFTQSSGVFVSTNSGTSWTDRSDANMTYYVKDLLVDPHDASQNTWYVSVWGGYGGPFATNNDAGGLYRSTNRGVSWTRLFKIHRVTSATISPTDANELYLTTEFEGLWWTGNLSAVTPTFEEVTSYPFANPERVHYDPFTANRIWVTSFGNGARIGTVGTSSISGWQMF